jgi:UDP-glucose 4-epimerase
VLASSLAPLAGSPPPVTELSPVRPLSPYGASKAAAEAYCSAYHAAYGLGTVVLRFANVYGPWSTTKTSVVASLIRCALAGEPLTVHGDGRQTRDFIHVEDLVNAVVMAGSTDRALGETLHVATGTETPVIDIARAVCDGLGLSRDRITLTQRRAGDPGRSVASPDRAARFLGWQPQVDWRTGVAQTCGWFQSRSVHQ